MGMKMVTPQAEIDAYIQVKLDSLRKAVIYQLKYVGESCIRQAREWKGQNNPYTDRTGNLRSSTGYVIVENGKVVFLSSFDSVKGGDGKEGEEFAQSLASKFPKGLTLVMVAGMNYAAYVSARGYDVLDSAEDLAAKLVPEMLNKLGFK